jgi:hypothetical protein
MSKVVHRCNTKVNILNSLPSEEFEVVPKPEEGKEEELEEEVRDIELTSSRVTTSLREKKRDGKGRRRRRGDEDEEGDKEVEVEEEAEGEEGRAEMEEVNEDCN